MTYREFAPPRSLANVIECVWTNSPNIRDNVQYESEAIVAHTILPDGAMDVICTFFPDGEIDETFVVGSMTRPQIATIDNRHFVGVRFLPGAGGSTLGINAATLTDSQVAIADITRHSARVRSAFRSLRLDSGNAHALHLFSQSINRNERDVPTLVRYAAKLLSTSFSSAHVAHVADELRVTRQHLTRVFSAHSGLTPKMFAQICRVRAVLAVAQSQHQSLHARTTLSNSKRVAQRDSWSQLSAQFGYVDQSHLIAEVHAIIGQTPAAWHAAAGSNIPILPVPVAPL